MNKKHINLRAMSFSMSWYQFWKKSGPMQLLTEKYVWLDDKIYTGEKAIHGECEYWAESMPGGHNTHYTYGYKKIQHPPKEKLEDMIKSQKSSVKEHKEHLGFLLETYAQISKKKICSKKEK